MKLISVANGTVQTTSVAKTILTLVAAFAGFLFREAYMLFNGYGVGGIIVGIIFVGGGVVAIFFAALPFVNVSSIKALQSMQSAIDTAENKLTPAQLSELQGLLSQLETFASQEGLTLSGLINQMLVDHTVQKQSTTTADVFPPTTAITEPVGNNSSNATGGGGSVSNTSKKV